MAQSCRKEYNEILEVLKLIPSYDYLKIPSEKIEYFKKHSIKNYDFKIDNLDSVKLSRNTYVIYTELYKEYIATNEEKEKINEILKLNRIKKQENWKEQDLFNNKKIENKIEEKGLTEIKKETIFKKIINKIKQLWKK